MVSELKLRPIRLFTAPSSFRRAENVRNASATSGRTEL